MLAVQAKIILQPSALSQVEEFTLPVNFVERSKNKMRTLLNHKKIFPTCYHLWQFQKEKLQLWSDKSAELKFLVQEKWSVQ